MGGDGGSIPRRTELVRNKKKKENVGKVASNAAKWKHCALSQEPLRQPIVACQLGRLYNKEAILEKLLDESKFTSGVADHIKKLKDVKLLKLTPNPKGQETHELNSGLIESSAETFCCPIMGLEMNGAYPFVFSWECGCVISKRAFDAVKDTACLNCGTPLKKGSIILLNPETEEELKEAQERLKVYLETYRKSKSRSSKEKVKSEPDVKVEHESGKKRHSPPSSVPGTGDSSHAKKMKAEPGKSKATTNEHPKEQEKEKRYNSVQDDPTASTVYKSLFTTSEEAKNQPKSHWVTFNPLYFR